MNAHVRPVLQAGEVWRGPEQGTDPALRPSAALAVVKGGGVMASARDGDHDQDVMLVLQVGKLPPDLESAARTMPPVHAVVVQLGRNAPVVAVQVAHGVGVTLLPEQLPGEGEGRLDGGGLVFAGVRFFSRWERVRDTIRVHLRCVLSAWRSCGGTVRFLLVFMLRPGTAEGN